MLRNRLIFAAEGLKVTRTRPNNAPLPITLQEMKAYLKVDFDAEDELISGLIDEIVSDVENRLGIALIPNTEVTFTLMQWPNLVQFPVNLGHKEIISVEIDGEAVTDAELYGGDLKLQHQGRGLLKVVYTCGACPVDIKSIIRRMVADLYEYRDSSGDYDPSKLLKRLERYRNMAYVA